MTTTTTTWNEAAPRRADNVEIAPRIGEDWLSLIIGLFIFVLALAGIANVDLPRKKTDRLESRHWCRPADHSCHPQPSVPSVHLTS